MSSTLVRPPISDIRCTNWCLDNDAEMDEHNLVSARIPVLMGLHSDALQDAQLALLPLTGSTKYATQQIGKVVQDLIERQKQVDTIDTFKDVHTLASTWSMTSQAVDLIQARGAEVAILRMIVMMTEVTVHKRLEAAIQSSFDESSSTGSWLQRLASDVKLAWSSSVKAKVFESSKYLPNHTPQVSYSLSFPRRRARPTLLHPEIGFIRSIVHSWLSPPDTTPASLVVREHQHLFLAALLDVAGANQALVLFTIPVVWDTYVDPPSGLLPRSSTKSKTTLHPQDLITFTQALRLHPLFNTLHPHHSSYASLSHIIYGHVQHILGNRPGRKKSGSGPSTRKRVSVHPDPIPAPIEPEAHVSHAHAEYIAYLRSLLAAESLEANERNSIQAAFIEKSDYYGAFRDKATSRARLLGSAGPTSSSIPSHSNLFSMLVFRGITFGTTSWQVSDHSGQFDSLNAWMEYLGVDDYDEDEITDAEATAEEAGEVDKSIYLNTATTIQASEGTEATFCSNSAYGRTQGRTTANAKHFWVLAKHLHRLFNHSCPPFDTVLLWIVKHIATFGRLTAFLVTADMAIAGWVKWTPEGIADRISWIGKGALAGLGQLGLVYGDQATQHKMSSGAFLDLHKAVEVELTNEEKKLIGFDIFQTEHALCKFKRLARVASKPRKRARKECMCCLNRPNSLG